MSVVRKQLIVRGHVQGVGYRVSCAHRAGLAGVTGWVRNLADGSVEVAVEGDEEAVQQLVDWCRKGPHMARVTGTDVTELTPTYEAGFEIR